MQVREIVWKHREATGESVAVPALLRRLFAFASATYPFGGFIALTYVCVYSILDMCHALAVLF